MHAEAESPCTVGNFGPGFDVFSLALARRGDKVWISTADKDRVSVRGPGYERVPTEWAKNSACASLDHLRAATGHTGALEVVIEKGMPPGSGLGSSASSNASAVRAFARLTGVKVTPRQALEAASAGESVASGSAHLDDVAAALFGGLVIVGGDGLDAVIRLRPPPLRLVVARPDLDLPTREMRKLIPQDLPRADVIPNMSSVARMVHACHEQDARMLCRALDDRISKPRRSVKIPGFAEMERAARKAGAEAFVLSGSGPAMMAVMPADVAQAPVIAAMRDCMASLGLGGETFDTVPLVEVKDPAIPMPGL
jgi:homoserine kinase